MTFFSDKNRALRFSLCLYATSLLDRLGEARYLPRRSRGASFVNKQLELLQGTLDMLSQRRFARPPARLRRFVADSTDFERSLGDSARLSLSGPISPRTPRLDHERIGRVGEQCKAKCLRLTAAGKRKLLTETEKWNRMADVIAGIWHTTPGEV